MARRRPNPWMLGVDAWSLGAESAAVIGLRMVKLAVGGASAEIEAQRMLSEKLSAAIELQALAMTGGLGLTAHSAAAKSIAHYRRKVRANQRRLQRD